MSKRRLPNLGPKSEAPAAGKPVDMTAKENYPLANKDQLSTKPHEQAQTSQEISVDPEMLYLKSELDNFIKIIAAIRMNQLDNHRR